MDHDEALRVIRTWHLPAIWECVLDQGIKRKKHQANASECWRIARESEGAEKETWQANGKTEEHGAESYRLAILDAYAQLNQIKQYLRKNFPRLLPIVPIVDLFEDADADAKQLSFAMLKLEGELLTELSKNEEVTDSKTDSATEPDTATSRVSINARMIEMMQTEKESAGWSCRKWGEMLECSSSAVQATPTWNALKVVKGGEKISKLEGESRRRAKPEIEIEDD